MSSESYVMEYTVAELQPEYEAPVLEGIALVHAVTPSRSPSPASSVDPRGDVDSFYDFVDVTDSAPPTLEDKDMNTNEHARHRRELLDLVNRLRAMGCPIECRLKHSDTEWTANVLLRFESGKGGYTGSTKEIKFGTTMTSRDEVQERIRRAQLAILNPTIDSLSFLTSDENAEYRSRSFSQNCVIVELSGSQLSDLNFVDLPGLIANVSDDRNIGDIQLVEKLVTSYI
ncbi:hypothetical protein FRC10_005392, partial [Ceratobasidium sp. 414]